MSNKNQLRLSQSRRDFLKKTSVASASLSTIGLGLGEMLIVEDGGDMRCMVRLPDGRTLPLMRLPGDSGATEVTGVAIAPTGDKIYVSGQRSLRNGTTAGLPASAGITYEIKMPFSVRVDRPLAGSL